MAALPLTRKILPSSTIDSDSRSYSSRICDDLLDQILQRHKAAVPPYSSDDRDLHLLRWNP